MDRSRVCRLLYGVSARQRQVGGGLLPWGQLWGSKCGRAIWIISDPIGYIRSHIHKYGWGAISLCAPNDKRYGDSLKPREHAVSIYIIMGRAPDHLLTIKPEMVRENDAQARSCPELPTREPEAFQKKQEAAGERGGCISAYFGIQTNR